MMDLGEARLVGGHRWGPLSPSFDGLHFMLGNTDEKWSLRVFGARPVQRMTTKLDWNTPETYFSGAYVTNRDLRWANFDGYFLQLNESDHLRQRNLSTTGFRLFAKPVKGSLDYEIESMYQFGDTRDKAYSLIAITVRLDIVSIHQCRYEPFTYSILHQETAIRTRISIFYTQNVGSNMVRPACLDRFSHPIYYRLSASVQRSCLRLASA